MEGYVNSEEPNKISQMRHFLPAISESEKIKEIMDTISHGWAQTRLDTVIKNEFNDRLEELESKVSRLEQLVDNLIGVDVSYLEVPDYDDITIQRYKEKVLNILKIGKEIDPWEFAELESIDIDLALLCFDLLIKEGSAEKIHG